MTGYTGLRQNSQETNKQTKIQTVDPLGRCSKPAGRRVAIRFCLLALDSRMLVGGKELCFMVCGEMSSQCPSPPYPWDVTYGPTGQQELSLSWTKEGQDRACRRPREAEPREGWVEELRAWIQANLTLFPLS